MKKYTLTFTLPYKMGAYSHVVLKDRLEREIQSYFEDRTIKVILAEED